MSDIAIGIDLGNSYSCVAVIIDGQPVVIPNEWGELTHASVVSFLANGTVLVGNAAKKAMVQNADHTVYSVKRLIGRFFISEEVKKAQKFMPYRIVEGPNNGVRIEVRGKTYSPSELSAFVLKEMKAIAESYLERPVNKAVITVPAYFNDNQRQATKDAGRIAGLEVLRIINEPTAAALAVGFGRSINHRIAVYDLGGGTFDISILDIGKDVFEVISTAGDTYLGGDDFDNRIITWLAEEFLKQTKLDLTKNTYCIQLLREAAEAAKIRVGEKGLAEIHCPRICRDKAGTVLDLKNRLTKEVFDKLIGDLVQKTFKVCDEALQAAKITAGDLDAVVLVGGPTRLPIVGESVRFYFGREPVTGVNPDQAVAIGAALQAHALLDEKTETFLIDVTPLPLRVGTVGGYSEKIIDKNAPIPIEQSKTFTTSRDGQDKVKVRIYQGDDSQVEYCELLGEFEFTGFRVALRGEVQISVAFEIDANGIVNVSATDLETGQRAMTTIRLSSGLTEADIQRSIAAMKRSELAGRQVEHAEGSWVTPALPSD